MTTKNAWQRDQLLIAFYLYCRMPFGKLHRGNQEIIHYASRIGRTPSSLAMKLTNIASLDPAITSTGRKGLDGASSADRAMWREMHDNWDKFAAVSQEAVDRANGRPLDFGDDTDGVFNDNSWNYDDNERLAKVKARIGQSFFRNAVLSAYNFRCCISDLAIPQLLVASHIVPWRTDSKNRLNPSNGLCLSMLHDKAFDLGLITITEDLKIRVSSKIKKSDDEFLFSSILKYEGQQLRASEKFSPNHEFLSYHRNSIFEKT